MAKLKSSVNDILATDTILFRRGSQVYEGKMCNIRQIVQNASTVTKTVASGATINPSSNFVAAEPTSDYTYKGTDDVNALVIMNVRFNFTGTLTAQFAVNNVLVGTPTVMKSTVTGNNASLFLGSMELLQLKTNDVVSLRVKCTGTCQALTGTNGTSWFSVVLLSK